MLRRVLVIIADWVVGIAILTLCLMVVWGIAGRDFTRDVESVVHAVLSSNQPVGLVVPPCPTEDSPGPCYWDADTMGNGVGASFTVNQFGQVTYWP